MLLLYRSVECFGMVFYVYFLTNLKLKLVPTGKYPRSGKQNRSRPTGLNFVDPVTRVHTQAILLHGIEQKFGFGFEFLIVGVRHWPSLFRAI